MICDSNGFPFYSRILDQKYSNIDDSVFSGFISAIGNIGKKLFNEEIATITFGLGKFNIIVVAKELVTEKRSIYFVFIVEGSCNQKSMKRFSTEIFIDTKQLLKNPKMENQDMVNKVDNIIDTKFGGLQYCD